DHSRRVIEAPVTDPMAAECNFGSFADSIAHERLHGMPAPLVCDVTDLGVRVQPIADSDRTCLGHERIDEFLIDLVLDEESCRRIALLTCITKFGCGESSSRDLDICILEDQHR